MNEKSPTEAPGRIRLAFWFSMQGDLRFLSHRELMRLWQRALARADVPVAFSRGFNPHPRMTLPLARSVGVSGRQELLLLEPDGHRPEPARRLSERLRGVLPAGMTVLAGRYVPVEKLANSRWARYMIWLCQETDTHKTEEILDTFRRASTWQVHRPRRGRHPQRSLDLKKGLPELVLRGRVVQVVIAPGAETTARLDEVTALLGLSGSEIALIERLQGGYPPPLQYEQN